MSSEQPEKPQTSWLPVPIPCARCNAPVKVQSTPSFSKILAILCSKCGWRFNVETVRIVARDQHHVPPETIPDPDHESDK